MQHAESTDAFDAMLSALAMMRYTPARNGYAYAIAVVVECDQALNYIQLVVERGRYISGVVATGDCAVFVIG